MSGWTWYDRFDGELIQLLHACRNRQITYWRGPFSGLTSCNLLNIASFQDVCHLDTIYLLIDGLKLLQGILKSDMLSFSDSVAFLSAVSLPLTKQFTTESTITFKVNEIKTSNGKGMQAPRTTQTERECKHRGRHKRKRNASTADDTNGKGTQAPRTNVGRFGPKTFRTQRNKTFRPQTFSDPRPFGPRFLSDPNLFGPKFRDDRILHAWITKNLDY